MLEWLCSSFSIVTNCKVLFFDILRRFAKLISREKNQFISICKMLYWNSNLLSKCFQYYFKNAEIEVPILRIDIYCWPCSWLGGKVELKSRRKNETAEKFRSQHNLAKWTTLPFSFLLLLLISKFDEAVGRSSQIDCLLWNQIGFDLHGELMKFLLVLGRTLQNAPTCF